MAHEEQTYACLLCASIFLRERHRRRITTEASIRRESELREEVDGAFRTGAAITVASWRMLPASEPTLAASATTVIAAPILNANLPTIPHSRVPSEGTEKLLWSEVKTPRTRRDSSLLAAC